MICDLGVNVSSFIFSEISPERPTDMADRRRHKHTQRLVSEGGVALFFYLLLC